VSDDSNRGKKEESAPAMAHAIAGFAHVLRRACPGVPYVPFRQVVTRAALVAGIAVSILWDEALYSGPVVAASAVLGAWPAFFLFSILYGSGGFLLSRALAKSYQKRLGSTEGRLQRWADHDADSRHGRWIRRQFAQVGWPGFVLASFALGPLATTWLAVSSGRVRGSPNRVAAASSVIFAVTFVGSYCGLGALLKVWLR